MRPGRRPQIERESRERVRSVTARAGQSERASCVRGGEAEREPGVSSGRLRLIDEFTSPAAGGECSRGGEVEVSQKRPKIRSVREWLLARHTPWRRVALETSGQDLLFSVRPFLINMLIRRIERDRAPGARARQHAARTRRSRLSSSLISSHARGRARVRTGLRVRASSNPRSPSC